MPKKQKQLKTKNRLVCRSKDISDTEEKDFLVDVKEKVIKLKRKTKDFLKCTHTPTYTQKETERTTFVPTFCDRTSSVQQFTRLTKKFALKQKTTTTKCERHDFQGNLQKYLSTHC